MNHPGRDGWAGAPAIEMLDPVADADERAVKAARARQARLRAMAAALGMLRVIPRQM